MTRAFLTSIPRHLSLSVPLLTLFAGCFVEADPATLAAMTERRSAALTARELHIDGAGAVPIQSFRVENDQVVVVAPLTSAALELFAGSAAGARPSRGRVAIWTRASESEPWSIEGLELTSPRVTEIAFAGLGTKTGSVTLVVDPASAKVATRTATLEQPLDPFDPLSQILDPFVMAEGEVMNPFPDMDEPIDPFLIRQLTWRPQPVGTATVSLAMARTTPTCGACDHGRDDLAGSLTVGDDRGGFQLELRKGKATASGNQASWVGDGYDLQVSYVER